MRESLRKKCKSTFKSELLNWKLFTIHIVIKVNIERRDLESQLFKLQKKIFCRDAFHNFTNSQKVIISE